MNIYIIKNDSFYKIGKANCVANRLSVLQTGSSSKLNLVAVKPSKEAVLIEHEIHSYLSENRVRGEWFLLNDLELNDVILRFGFCTNFPISSKGESEHKKFYRLLSKTVKNPIVMHCDIVTASEKLMFLEKTIFYYLLFLFREKGDVDYYEITVNQVCIMFKTRINNTSFSLRVEELSNYKFNIKEVDIKFIKSFEKINGKYRFIITTEAKEYFLGLTENYIALSLDTVIKLGSKYSRRMYEILSILKFNKKVLFSVEKLKLYLGVPSWLFHKCFVINKKLK